MSTCREVTSRFLLILSIFLMFKSQPQKDCSQPINHWVLVMWALLTSKYFTMTDRPVELSPWVLFFGVNNSNPIIFYWLIVGMRYVSSASGSSCYEKTSLTIVIMQIVVGVSCILFFVVGVLFMVIFIINRILYYCFRLVYGRERADQIPFFRNARIFIHRREMEITPTLDVDQIDVLKSRLEKMVRPEDLVTEKFRDNPCSICLDHLEEGQMSLSLRCSHFFHTICLEQWLKKRNTCPLCKDEVKTEDYEDNNHDNDLHFDTTHQSSHLMTDALETDGERASNIETN